MFNIQFRDRLQSSRLRLLNYFIERIKCFKKDNHRLVNVNLIKKINGLLFITDIENSLKALCTSGLPNVFII